MTKLHWQKNSFKIPGRKILVVTFICVSIISVNNAVAAPLKLYWTDLNLDLIQRSNLDGSNVETIAQVPGITYLAVDPNQDRIFYAIGSPTPQIWSMDYEGGDNQLLSTLDVSHYVRGMDFDASSNQLFWSSSDGYTSGGGKIRASNADGSNVHDVIDLDLVKSKATRPYGMAVDETLGRLFWSNVYENTIEQADLDGSNRMTAATSSNIEPNMIAIDSVTQKLYWIDGTQNEVLWSNYDGTAKQSIGVVSNFSLDSALTVDHESGYLFWSDTMEDTIIRSQLDGSDPTIINDQGSYVMSLLVVEIPEPTSGALLILAATLVSHRRRNPSSGQYR